MNNISNDIRKLLWNTRLDNPPNDIKLTPITFGFFQPTINKLLQSEYDEIFIYNPKPCIQNDNKGILPITKSEHDANIKLCTSIINNINEKHIYLIFYIVIPMNNISHFVLLIINRKLKNTIYFDSFGIEHYNNSLIYKQIRSQILTELKNNGHSFNKYKHYVYNIPIQQYIKDDDVKNEWLFCYSCIICSILFCYIYIKNKGNNKKVIKLLKSIKHDDNTKKIVQELLLFIWISIIL